MHLFGNVAPVAGDRGARRARSSRTRRRPPARSARTGARARSGRSRRSPSTRPRTSARSATAARSRPPTRRSPTSVRTLRFHGSRDKVTYEQVGLQLRLDELQAAVLRVMLPELEHWAAHRHLVGRLVRGGRPRRARGAARARRRRARPPGTSTCPPPARRRAAGGARRGGHRVARLLPHAGAPPAGDARRGATSELPGTDEAARTHLALPISAAITREQVAEVVEAVRAAGVG